jgi:hypothetical protein
MLWFLPWPTLAHGRRCIGFSVRTMIGGSADLG